VYGLRTPFFDVVVVVDAVVVCLFACLLVFVLFFVFDLSISILFLST